MNNSIDERRCPVCGNNNSCQAVVHNQTKQISCWCKNTEYQFPVKLIKRIPEKYKNKTCICKSCAQIYSKTGLN